MVDETRTARREGSALLAVTQDSFGGVLGSGSGTPGGGSRGGPARIWQRPPRSSRRRPRLPDRMVVVRASVPCCICCFIVRSLLTGIISTLDGVSLAGDGDDGGDGDDEEMMTTRPPVVFLWRR